MRIPIDIVVSFTSRQGRDRCVPSDKPEHDGVGPRAEADDLSIGPLTEALHSSSYPRPKPALLLHLYQLPEE